jgi:hypothetical protein
VILCRVKTDPAKQARGPKQAKAKADAARPKAPERARDATEAGESRDPAEVAARAADVLKWFIFDDFGKEVIIMPGFDRTGPTGMGSMTGGARGLCNPERIPQTDLMAAVGYGRGRGRGHRNVYRATGLPGWKRSNQAGFRGMPSGATYAPEQELDLLKRQTNALKAELDAINTRIQEIESRSKDTF